jgi:hypothetical protein
MKSLNVKKEISKVGINKDSKVCLEVCLGEFIDSLHLNFIITKEKNKLGSHIIVSLKDEIIAAFELLKAEKVFWKIMEELRKKGLQESKITKK